MRETATATLAWLHRLSVRIGGFHPPERGSTPLGAILSGRLNKRAPAGVNVGSNPTRSTMKG